MKINYSKTPNHRTRGANNSYAKGLGGGAGGPGSASGGPGGGFQSGSSGKPLLLLLRKPPPGPPKALPVPPRPLAYELLAPPVR